MLKKISTFVLIMGSINCNGSIKSRMLNNSRNIPPREDQSDHSQKTQHQSNNNNIIERVFLDIWTNGSISPTEALKSAAQITIDLFTLILENKETEKNNQLEPKTRAISIEPYTNIAIEELQLSVRAYNCLKKAQINTVGDLLQYSPEKLQELKNFGRKSADEVFSTLKNKLGIILK